MDDLEHLFDNGVIHATPLGELGAEEYEGGRCLICGTPLKCAKSKVCSAHSDVYGEIKKKIKKLCKMARERNGALVSGVQDRDRQE